jgi:iron complex outermembrane receptor protein
LLLGSDANPGADANGNIHVVPGDRIPDIARHRGTVVVTYNVTPAWTFGGNAVLQSSQYRVGDEANLSKPVGGYMVVDLNTAYRITDSVTIFGVANNVFNERYATYGAFADFTGLPFPQVPGGTIGASRTASPGMPIAGYGGVKVSF